MHTKSDWIRAICTDPTDDTLRLVFADWLEENGKPERAKLIRQDIWKELKNVSNSVIDVMVGGPLLLWGKYGVSSYGCKKGFVHWIELATNNFLTHCETLFKEQPVERVRLTDCTPQEYNGLFYWEKYGSDWAGDFLVPSEVFTLLPTVGKDDWQWTATSSDLALSCLSQACVTYGRIRAGLPISRSIAVG